MVRNYEYTRFSLILIRIRLILETISVPLCFSFSASNFDLFVIIFLKHPIDILLGSGVVSTEAVELQDIVIIDVVFLAFQYFHKLLTATYDYIYILIGYSCISLLQQNNGNNQRPAVTPLKQFYNREKENTVSYTATC